jgi:hypothetical protein
MHVCLCACMYVWCMSCVCMYTSDNNAGIGSVFKVCMYACMMYVM